MENEQLRKLVEDIKGGDRLAFSKLYNYYYDRLVGYAYKRLYKIEDAQDIVSNVFVKVLDKIEDFKWKDGGFNGWIYTVTLNEIRQFQRRSNRVKSIGEELLDLPDSTQSNDMEAVLIDRQLSVALEQLKPEYQEILSLRYWEEFSLKEIAEVMKMNENTVRVYLTRAVKTLGKLLNNVNEN